MKISNIPRLFFWWGLAALLLLFLVLITGCASTPPAATATPTCPPFDSQSGWPLTSQLDGGCNYESDGNLPTNTPPSTCAEDISQLKSLSSSSKLVTYQGIVQGRIVFTNGDLFFTEGNNGSATKINTERMIEGPEYTVEIPIRVKPDSMGTLLMNGFVCGNTFYFVYPHGEPFFIG